MTKLNQLATLRIDKWLWAARFYKTRQLAMKALKNSQIELHQQVAKPATHVKVGDMLMLKRGLYQTEIEIIAISETRSSTTIAQTLYSETSASIARRTALKAQLANQPKVTFNRRKPDKRNIRSQRARKRGE